MAYKDGPHPLDIELGHSIRARRKQIGLSQTSLGEAVGISFQQIQKYERGFNRVSFSTLAQIANALGCRVADLIGELDTDRFAPALPVGQTDLLRHRDAPALLEAYAAIPPALRKAIVKLVVELGRQTA